MTNRCESHLDVVDTTYSGYRMHGRLVVVKLSGAAVSSLAPRPDLLSQVGVAGVVPFDCGDAGVGARALAVSILADHCGSDASALAHHEAYRWDVIARLPAARAWMLRDRSIAAWLARQEAEAAS